MKEYDRWMKPPITFGTYPTLHDQGSRILLKLAALSFPVPSYQFDGPELVKHIKIIHHDTGNVKPNMHNVLKDLTEAGAKNGHISTINFRKNGPADHNPIEIVLKSIILSGGRYDSPAEGVNQLGALTIPASKSGLGSIDLLPKQVKDCTEVVYELRNADNKKSNKNLVPFWASCLNPMGAITGPHTDYSGSSQVIQHIEGRKIWLCWPPTPHNLDIYV
jgi:hypothetical protein